jgi:hypothetical protein
MKTTAFLLTMLVPAVVSAQQKPTTGYAPVNGLKTYYEVHGSGDPVVLLHGSFMTITNNWTQWIGEQSNASRGTSWPQPRCLPLPTRKARSPLNQLQVHSQMGRRRASPMAFPEPAAALVRAGELGVRAKPLARANFPDGKLNPARAD